jgi:UDPglucose--hexose-1-phosphate uridylyltransferase
MEIAAYRTNGQPANSSEWLVRVIPEWAPLLRIEGSIQREGFGIYDKVSSRGASEVVIESPHHTAQWETMPLADLERVLWMYRERVADLHRDPQIRAVVVLRTGHGPGPEADHPFSRIIGAPIVFDDVRQELVAARNHYAYKQRCLYCDIVRQERGEATRLVEESPHFLVFAPYGAHRAFETWVVPLTHRHRFEDISPEEVGDLAGALQRTFRRLRSLQPDAPLAFTLHTAPNESMRLRQDEWRTLADDYHWHVEIAPNGRALDTLGGFAVNPVSPEVAADQLRHAL